MLQLDEFAKDAYFAPALSARPNGFRLSTTRILGSYYIEYRGAIPRRQAPLTQSIQIGIVRYVHRHSHAF